MHVEGIVNGRARLARLRRVAGAVGVAGVLLVGAGACGSAGPGGADPDGTRLAAPDAATKPYCDTVARVQAEQSAPGAGQGGVTAAAAATRRQLADLVRTAPPDIAGEWRGVQQLTERSLVFLEATRGDPAKIDRAALERLRQAAEPAQARIKGVTEQRCGVTFRAPS